MVECWGPLGDWLQRHCYQTSRNSDHPNRNNLKHVTIPSPTILFWYKGYACFSLLSRKNDAHNFYLFHACNQRNSSDCAKTLYYCKIFRLCEPSLKDRKHPRIPLTVIFAKILLCLRSLFSNY